MNSARISASLDENAFNYREISDIELEIKPDAKLELKKAIQFIEGKIFKRKLPKTIIRGGLYAAMYSALTHFFYSFYRFENNKNTFISQCGDRHPESINELLFLIRPHSYCMALTEHLESLCTKLLTNICMGPGMEDNYLVILGICGLLLPYLFIEAEKEKNLTEMAVNACTNLNSLSEKEKNYINNISIDYQIPLSGSETFEVLNRKFHAKLTELEEQNAADRLVRLTSEKQKIAFLSARLPQERPAPIHHFFSELKENKPAQSAITQHIFDFAGLNPPAL